ncbi:hypothetical protein BKA93DRAFT_797371 [Sparassis latifolia]
MEGSAGYLFTFCPLVWCPVVFFLPNIPLAYHCSHASVGSSIVTCLASSISGLPRRFVEALIG